ncbi:MAG: ATP phosphoribosyltransferase regulatory subunit, partial [Lachnospiraceae bacterium]|nr:ATP phosphoribosyltransferase regulatory subunit [Lachnospiraceae bacterium]
LPVSQGLREIFLKLPDIQGELSTCVAYIKERTKSTRVMQALERLQKLETILRLYGFMDYVTIDMSMLSHYSYYTGVIFRAYTYGNGEAVATGGRYDSLVGQFGMDVPAIGLAIVLDQLMIALERQKRLQEAPSAGVLLLYPKEAREQALKQAAELRAAGEVVQMLRKSSKVPLEEYEEYAKRNGNERVLYIT